MTAARFIVGSCLHELAHLPAGSVDLVVTSPPFLGLRDYLDEADPLKPHEHGRVGTPLEFVHEMLDMVEAVGRVLAPHGSLVIELGDSMAGSGGAGGDYDEDGQRAGQPKPAGSAKLARQNPRYREGTPRWDRPGSGQVRSEDPVPRPTKGRRRDGEPQPRTRDVGKAARSYEDPATGRRPGVLAMRSTGPGWPDDKSLAMIPELLRIAMAYGAVPFSDRTTERWLVRNVVRWCKPNPSVGDEGDKFRRGCNDMLVATQAPDRYWDRLAARGPSRSKAGETSPLLDWWELPTGQFRGAHHATFPLDLVAPLIASMCPERVCTTCGQPSRRIIRKTDEYEAARPGGGDMYAAQTGENDRGTGRNGAGGHPGGMVAAQYEHVGWTDCEHGTWRRGLVLDPYAGTGSTLSAAVGAGRDAIGIDLDHRNVELAVNRIGPMFITIEEGTSHAEPATA